MQIKRFFKSLFALIIGIWQKGAYKYYLVIE